MPVVRYPGGNFVSGYRWEDGIGPREQRPVRLDLAWKTTEPNQFGANEFVTWCRKVNSAPMLAVNLGTRGPEEARNLVEYCNHPGGSQWSDLRRGHGYASPHGVKLWCLGNEMDGPWQMGHKTATEYGRVACEAAKLMKWTDPTIELVVCGSSGRGMATFGNWELEVLDHTFNHVDYLSIHTYYGNADNDTPNFLAKPDSMSEFIEEVVALCDRVKIGCIAQVVNVIAPIMTVKGGPAWRQTIFYPFLHASNVGRGRVLRPLVTVPRYDCKERKGVPYLTAACVHDPASGGLTLFAVNRRLDQKMELRVDLRAFDGLCVREWLTLRHDDLRAANTPEAPDTVVPRQATGAAVDGSCLSAVLEPASWNVIRMGRRQQP